MKYPCCQHRNPAGIRFCGSAGLVASNTWRLVDDYVKGLCSGSSVRANGLVDLVEVCQLTATGRATALGGGHRAWVPLGKLYR